MHQTKNFISAVFTLLFLSFLFQACESNSPNNKTVTKINIQEDTSSTFYLGGIQVNEADINHWTKTLKKIGMNTVEVTVYLNHSVWNHHHVFWDEQEKGMIDEIRAAKKEGLKVVLILRTSLHSFYEENKFLWHGRIMPKGEERIKKWFDKYQEFALEWAKICEVEGVEIMGIGSEMNAMAATQPIKELPELYRYYNDVELQKEFEERALKYKDVINSNYLLEGGKWQHDKLEDYLSDRIQANKKWVDEITFEGEYFRIEKINKRSQFIEKQWVKLIGAIRGVYNGKLTYAANFDNYMNVGFWEHLDFIGINAYFPLRNFAQNKLSDSEMKSILKSSWDDILKDIEIFNSSNSISHKPVIFTELGYVQAEDSTINPWQGFGFSIVGSDLLEKIILWDHQPLHPKERQLAVDALKEAVDDQQFNLVGILYWKLTTHPYHLNDEPFALHIAEQVTDSLQTVLADFNKE
jgi:ligand-binding SRPBCC domain-containing protein